MEEGVFPGLESFAAKARQEREKKAEKVVPADDERWAVDEPVKPKKKRLTWRNS